MIVNRLRFGPAGIPNSSPAKDLQTGLRTVKELGLDAMELEFVYGVRINPKIIPAIREFAEKNDILLTAHAPYYINLAAKEKYKIERSIQNILNTARVLDKLNGYSVVFHPGYYMKRPKEAVYQIIKENLKKVLDIAKDEGLKVWIRPETMDLLSRFGSVEELFELTHELETLPCIDFAHIRYRYGTNKLEFFRDILERYENVFGKEGLRNMHIHMSGIKLDKKATHLNLKESDMPWQGILDLLKEFNVKGVVISESPNLEEDALMMKNYYYKRI